MRGKQGVGVWKCVCVPRGDTKPGGAGCVGVGTLKLCMRGRIWMRCLKENSVWGCAEGCDRDVSGVRVSRFQVYIRVEYIGR